MDVTPAGPAAVARARRIGFRVRRVLFGSVIALYVLAFPYHPKLRSPNELCRLWQTRALVEYGTLHINDALRDYGYVGDLSRVDTPQGRLYYPSKAPLLSFAGVPIYKVLRDLGGGDRHAVPELPLLYWHRLLLTVLPTLLMLVLVRRFLRAFIAPLLADALTGVYALGTLAFSYSLLFISHQTTAVLVFSSFYVLWRVLRGDWAGTKARAGYVLAGALAGATVAAEYTGALPVIAVFVYGVIAVLVDRTRSLRERILRLGEAAGLATLGALPFVGGLMWYHQVVFGHPLHSGYKYLNDAAYQPWHMGGFLGIRYPDPRAFLLSFFSPLRGLFTLSPVLLAAVPGFVLLWRWSRRRAAGVEAPAPAPAAADRAIFWLVALVFAGYTYFTSSFSYESWGWTTGPRHLTPLVPFLLLPVALVFQRCHERASSTWRWAGGVLAGLAAGAILVTGISTLINYIPDSASNPVFGVALPLLREGYWPPSFLMAFGVPAAASTVLLVLLIVVAAALVFAMLVPKDPVSGRGMLGTSLLGVAICAVYLGALAAATRHDDGDRGALRVLRQTWLLQPGQDVEFWPERR